MRVCVLQGSLHPRGNTEELVRPFAQALREGGAQVETIALRDKAVAPCLGCYRCQNAAGKYGCVQQDDMQKIVESILRADILVFATPIYTWQATAPMKAVMDRMYGLNKFYGSAPRACLNEGQCYALLATCGYDIDYGAGLLDEAMRRWCAHSGRLYLGMCAVRDEDDLRSFQTDKAVQGARGFAARLIQCTQHQNSADVRTREGE